MPAFWNARTDAPETDEQLDAVINALPSLPKRQRLVLSLRCEVGLSTLETAVVMGISESAAKQLLARARESLRRGIETSAQGVSS